ncbi:MAG: zinc ABC transporter substrate-binding protein [Clostridia bacterium]|nr:zinc ABC transporter substrate-binding protein [Clostridia bacterium]
MKKFLLFCLLLCLVTPAALADSQPLVVTSFYPIYGMAVNLLKEVPVTVQNLAAPQVGCLHDYTLSTQDMRTLHEARVFLINGAGMEGFLAQVADQFPELKQVVASEGITLMDEGNPHLWLDAQAAIWMTKNLAQGLVEAFPEHAEKIMANQADYQQRLETLDEELKAGLSDLPRRDIVTFHEAFPYFAKAYGLNVAAVVNREPGDALSPAQLAQLITDMKDLGVPPLFIEPQYPELAAQTLSRETGAKVYTLDPIVTGPLDENALTAYEEGMRRNMKTLQEALSE